MGLDGVSSLVILSETALALYPILIKTVPTNLPTQLVARLLTYGVLGFVLAGPSDIRDTWGRLGIFGNVKEHGLFRTSTLSLMTLAHVGSSYLAFQELPAGISMSLFYSYPIFNLLGAALGFGERFGVWEMFLVGVAFAGVLLVASQAKEGFEDGSEKKSLNWKGILAGLAAAITESGMYFAVRTAKQPNPFYAVLELYPAALPMLLAVLAYMGKTIDLRASVWGPMILFNTIVGFVGYCLRFYAIPRVSTLLFSVLSFIGVVASFGWGWLFVGETPTWISALGATLITLAAGATKTS